MRPHVHQSTTQESQLVETVKSPGTSVRLPVDLIGRLLDWKPKPGDKVAGTARASIYAIHIAFIKRHRFDFDGGALNERYLAKKCGIGRRKSRAGIKVLKDTEILDRRSGGRGKYAKEQPLAPSARGYVELPAHILSLPSDVVAFIVAALLPPFASRARDVARRIGITSRTTIGPLVQAAVAAGAIDTCYGAAGELFVGRKGKLELAGLKRVRPAKKVTSKTVPSKTVTFKNVTTHTLLLEGHSESLKELTSSAARSAIIERAPRDNFCEGRQAPSECDGFEGHEIANELCAADHARVLLPNLLTPAGLRPLLDLIQQHGPRAMQVVRATLTKAAIDGWPRNKIKTWAYFLPELASEAEAEEREAGGIRPGDVLGSWRDRPMDSDISEARGRPPEHSPAAEAHLRFGQNGKSGAGTSSGPSALMNGGSC